jgi:multiple sugar transport system substrate-binding protein
MMADKQMSRRRFLQLSAVMAAGSVAVACAAPAPEGITGNVSAPAAEARTVTFMSTGGEADQLMFQNALKVAAEQPALAGNNIVVEWQPDPGGGWDKIMSMFASDTAYDVQRIDDDRVAELAMNNKIHQLDCMMELHQMNVDDYFPLFWKTLNLGGYQYSMVPVGGTNTLYYNRALFEEAGVDLPPTSWADAWSWEDFVVLAEKLAKKDSSGRPEQYALGFPKNVITPIAYGAGGSFVNEQQTSCTMAEQAVIDAVDQFVQLTAPGGPEWFSPPGLDTTELFNAGKLALNWASSNWYSNISQDIDWGICPWMKTSIHAMTENFDRAFVIPKSAVDSEAAFLLLKTLCEQPTVDILAQGRFGVPYFKAAAESPSFLEGRPDNKQVWVETMGEVNGHRVDVPTPRGPAGAYKVTFTDGPYFESALSGQISTQEALAQACAKAEEELSGWNWQAGLMETKLLEAGAVTCENIKMWPETDWP